MNYKKYRQGNYNLHIVNTDKFKKVRVMVNFKRDLRKEEVTLSSFLTDMLVTSSKKFPTNRDIVIETENLYSVGVTATTIKSGKYSLLSFTTNFLNEKYTEKGMNEKSIAFFMELLFNPNVNKNAFDESSFDLVKRGLEDDINSTKDSPRRYSLLRMYDELAPNSKISYHPSGYLEDLEKITRENLYNFYKDVIEHSIVDIFVIGEISDNDIKKMIEKYFIEPKEKNITGNHILTHASYEEEKFVKETMKISQSRIVLGLKVEELTDFERQYVMNIFSFIFGQGGDSKLFQTVREKNSLCYDISLNYSYLTHILVVTAGIDKKNTDVFIELVKGCLKEMVDGEFTNDQIKKGIITYVSACEEIDDSASLIANVFLAHEYLNNDLIDDKIINIKKVNKKMVASLAKKIHLDTIFLLEGDESNAKQAS